MKMMRINEKRKKENLSLLRRRASLIMGAWRD